MSDDKSAVEKKSYTVNADGWVAGQWREAGTPLELTEAQAKYENVTLVLEGDQKPAGEASKPAKSKAGSANK